MTLKVLYVCVGMNDLGGTSSHLRRIVQASPSAGLDATLWVTTKIPEELRGYFSCLGPRVRVETNYKTGAYLPLIWRLASAVRALKIDVLHSYQLQSDIICAAAGTLARVPALVSSFEGRLVYGSTWLRGRALAVMNRLVRWRFDANVFISTPLLTTYGRAYAIPKKKQRLVHSGIEEHWFDSLPDPRRNDPPRIGFVGRIDREKGYELFIEAAGMLARRRLNARFLLIGGGQCMNDAKHRAEALSSSSEISIEFLGWCADVRSAIDSLDLVVLPSHEEGLPAVAIEALARAKPVIASHVGGFPEILGDGAFGTLVAPERPDLLADAIEQAMKEWPRLHRKALQGHHSVRQRFTIQKEVRALHSVYDSLLSTRSFA